MKITISVLPFKKYYKYYEQLNKRLDTMIPYRSTYMSSANTDRLFVLKIININRNKTLVPV